jgi:nitrogen-specific signal transduction histidine kinase
MMDSQYENELRTLQMRFIGKIIAGFTHEIKNYIAIINESNGLIGDMMKLGKSPENELPVYLDIIHSIEDYIEKTTGHFRYLNRFAHRMDAPLSSFHINESLEELIALINRFANQKRISFKQGYDNDMPPVYSNPSLLQLIIFTFVEKNIMELEQDSTITMQTAVADKSVLITIIPNGKRVEGSSAPIPTELLDIIIKELGGNISQDRGKNTVIMLPLTSSSMSQAT